MTGVELRRAKAELHCEMLKSVLSKDGTLEEDILMYQYIIEQASKELVNLAIRKGE